MNVLCLSCGHVHESKAEQLDCNKQHGGMRHTHRWAGAGMGADVAEYLGEGLSYYARLDRREPRPNEELDFDEAA